MMEQQNDVAVKMSSLEREKLVLIYKMKVINLLGGNISDYLIKKGIQNIILYGDSELVKFVAIDIHYLDKVSILRVFSNNVESEPLSKISIFLSFNAINDSIRFDDNVVLVCNPKKNSLNKNHVNLIELADVIDNLYIDYLLYRPLYEIMKKNNFPIVLLFFPELAMVKNCSENEKSIKEQYLGISRLRALINNKEIDNLPEGIKRYSNNIDYIHSIVTNYPMFKKDGIYRLHEKQSLYVNIIQGCRKTCYQPNEYNGTIYFFGHSKIYGIGSEDKDTIESHFQNMVNNYAVQNGILSRLVINHANLSSQNFLKMFPLIDSIQFQQNDIIVVPGIDPNIAKEYGFITCETQEAFNRPHDMGEVFIDTVHLNSEGNKKVAECVLKTFIEHDLLSGDYQNKNISNMDDKIPPPVSQSANQSEYNTLLNEYKQTLLQTHDQTLGKIGSIVMNCNPFTLGHRYLIEYAANKVKHLFIFVVEEDKSIFLFKDRLELVKAGTVDLENVTILPSGQFIISSLTFADYFDKAEIQDRVIDPSNDVELFAKEIAPTLGITVRFAGEEPLDNITKQYNDAMQRILPQYGIQFEVIPRKESNGEVISASRVRKLLETKDFDAIAKIVPETTLRYLKEKFE